MYLTKNSKSPFYQIIYEVNGNLTTHTTKKRLKSEALKYLSEFEKHLENSIILKPITLKEFQKEYEKYIEETKSKKYLRSVQFSFKMLNEFAGEIQLSKIDVKLVESFIQSKYKTSKSSASLCYRNLKASLSTALRWNYIKSNPFQAIKQPKQISKFPIYISEVELQKILKNVLNPRLKNMILISFDAGLRLGEVVSLKWTDIDLQQKIIKVSNSKEFTTKSKQDRIIPMTDRLYKMFLTIAPNVFTLKENTDFIFIGKNKVRYNLDYISRSFKRVIRANNLNEAYTYHTLRHSFASNLVNRGVSLFIVSKLLGHQDLKTTQIYSHLQPENLFEAVDKLNKKVAQ